jgi:hypothetical protein
MIRYTINRIQRFAPYIHYLPLPMHEGLFDGEKIRPSDYSIASVPDFIVVTIQHQLHCLIAFLLTITLHIIHHHHEKYRA